MTGNDDFFAGRSDQSAIKTRIVAKFFASWSKVIAQSARRSGRKPRLAYIDLFAGPGSYQDGSKSTPLLIIEEAIQTPSLAEGLVTIFNDADPDHAASLRKAIKALPGYERLTNRPKFLCDEVDDDFENTFAEVKLIPTMSFVDPFGYKGVTARLIHVLSKDWGSDCILFFNYRRINSAVTNDNFRPHMEAMFGRRRLETMRHTVSGMKPWRRREYILRMMSEALKERGLEWSLYFLFKNETGTRVTHGLIYVTKHPLGLSIMKEIMAGESSSDDHGVPSFEYNPADSAKPLQLDLNNPILDLANELAKNYAGRRLRVDELIQKEEPKSRYLKRNFRDAILELERSGRLRANPAASKRPNRNGRPTCGPAVVLFFPNQFKK